MDKIFDNVDSAFDGLLKDGISIMVGGIDSQGVPEDCVDAIIDSGISDITVISCDCGSDDVGVGRLLRSKQVGKLITSHAGDSKEFSRQFMNNDIKVEFSPMGTLAERVRAGGAAIPAFYVKTAAGTDVGSRKENRKFDGETYVMERALVSDIAVIKAKYGDRYGNLIFSGAERNFNPIMAMAGDVVVAEVEEIVEPEEMDADSIHLAGIFVQRIFQSRKRL